MIPHHPLPWRAAVPPRSRDTYLSLYDANGKEITVGGGGLNEDVAELIVRLVNAEPDVVAALKASYSMLSRTLQPLASDLVCAALAKVVRP